jgi:hypothetical protein
MLINVAMNSLVYAMCMLVWCCALPVTEGIMSCTLRTCHCRYYDIICMPLMTD